MSAKNSAFDIILADPPWHFRNFSGDAPGKIHDHHTRGAMQYYPTMTTNDICRLQIPAADDAVLFLWACWPHLLDALRVIDAWGFTYKTEAWVWIKSRKNGTGFHFGMGYYTRANTEPCLFATRGKPGRPVDKSISALIYAPVGQHSKKPGEQYDKIERLYPGRTYLELFARQARPGWGRWGNEVDSTIDVTTRPAGGGIR